VIVVADTSPLNYLVQIGCIDVLPDLFGTVIVPAAVFQELTDADAPTAVSRWAQSKQPWMELSGSLPHLSDVSDELDEGEREALQLAINLKANLILMDERNGVAEAARLSIPVTGTLGVVLLAGRQNLIDARLHFARLVQTTNFRSSSKLRKDFAEALTRAAL
jgi:predicted nucleic acid-binding protein